METEGQVIKSQLVESLPQFLKLVSDQSNQWNDDWKRELEERHEKPWAASWLPWFRGEDSVAWWLSGTALRPKLYRKTVAPKRDAEEEIKTILNLEAEMRVEFRRRGAQLITERAPVNKWEWYFLMQHYSAPTRLLDWSDAALVGLYFAVAKRGKEGDSNAGHDAAVYMLDPWWLNAHAFIEVDKVAEEYRSYGPALPDWDEAKHYLASEEFDNDELGVKCPLAIDPSHFLRRLAAQRSCFTIFGREKDGLRYTAGLSRPHLVRFDVKEECIRQIKQDLRWAGIAEDTVFPDLEGLGRYFSNWFDDKYRENEAKASGTAASSSRTALVARRVLGLLPKRN